MTCRFCYKEFPDGFKYCPNCGKKIAIETPFTRLDWYRSAAGRKEAEEKWPEIREMSFKELTEHLAERLPMFTVWSIGGFYVEAKDRKYKYDKSKGSFKAISINEARFYVKLLRNGTYSDLLLTPAKKEIAKRDLHDLDVPGGSIFRTEEECQAAINELMYDPEWSTDLLLTADKNE